MELLNKGAYKDMDVCLMYGKTTPLSVLLCIIDFLVQGVIQLLVLLIPEA